MGGPELKQKDLKKPQNNKIPYLEISQRLQNSSQERNKKTEWKILTDSLCQGRTEKRQT